MWGRDIVMACVWAATKIFSGFMFVACVLGFIQVLLGNVPPDTKEPAGIAIALTLAAPIFFWVFHNLTDFPLLFWRRRKFHVLRILENTEGQRAIQIRLFGIWFYVLFDEGDASPQLALFGWTDLHRLRCWVGYSHNTMQGECNNLIDAIRPPQVSVEKSADVIYENYTRKTMS